MSDKVKYRTDSKGVKVKLTFDEKNKVWRSPSKEFDQKPIPDIRNKPEKEKKDKRESNKPDVKYIYDTSGKTNKTIPLTKTKSPKRLGSSRLAGGGRATHGYGKAYLKGGRVK